MHDDKQERAMSQPDVDFLKAFLALSVNLPKYNIHGSDDSHNVSQHMTFNHIIHR